MMKTTLSNSKNVESCDDKLMDRHMICNNSDYRLNMKTYCLSFHISLRFGRFVRKKHLKMSGHFSLLSVIFQARQENRVMCLFLTVNCQPAHVEKRKYHKTSCTWYKLLMSIGFILIQQKDVR